MAVDVLCPLGLGSALVAEHAVRINAIKQARVTRHFSPRLEASSADFRFGRCVEMSVMGSPVCRGVDEIVVCDRWLCVAGVVQCLREPGRRGAGEVHERLVQVGARGRADQLHRNR